jgi:hypothetical protein
MRTKALLCLAALAAGVVTASAQVYSLNVVGYINVTVPANGFAMIANQLDSGNNTLGSLIPIAPDGAQFFKYNGSYTASTYDGLGQVWDNPGITLNPGEGGFFHNNTASALTLTFVGQVMQGTLNNPLPAGYAIRSSIVPQQGTLQDLGIPITGAGTPSDGDQVFVYNGGYSASTFDSLIPGWDTAGSPGGPTIAVGQAFFIKSATAYTWTRSFTVQ